MLNLALFVIVMLLSLRVLYALAISMWSWRVPPPSPVGERRRRFVVAIPAHNESRVITGVIEDIREQIYGSDRVEIAVIADRCTDSTSSLALAAGADVYERVSGSDGKGSALAWFLRLRPLGEDEALVVLDADNRVPHDLLASFSDELDAGHEVLQTYIDTSNPDASIVSLASALSYWSSSRLVQLARRNLRLSSQLGGTGMCFSGRILHRVGGFESSLTEDQDLEYRIIESGARVIWLHHVRVLDEKPTSVSVLTQQRARWAAGNRTNRTTHARPLVKTASRGSVVALDRLLELVLPSKTLTFVLLLVVLLLSTVVVGIQPWLMVGWMTLMAETVAVVGALIAEGVPASRIIRLPYLFVFAVTWIPARLSSWRQTSWVPTPHTGSSDRDSEGSVESSG